MNRRPCRAFTLLEVCVALAITIALLGAILWMTSEIALHRKRYATAAVEIRAGSAVVDRIAASLATCVVGNERLGAGLRGDERSLEIVYREQSALAWRGATDLARLAIHAGDETSIELRGGVIAPPRQSTAADAVERVEGISRIQFSYLKRHEWAKAFDSFSSGELPDAVQVSVWFGAISTEGDAAGTPARSPDRVRIIAILDSAGDDQ